MSPLRARPPVRRYYFLGLLLFVLITCVYLFFTYRSLTAPVSPTSKDSISFEVKKGETTLGIANNLHAAGLIRSPFGFRLVVKKEGLSGKLQAGVYQISPSLKASQIARLLSRGFNDLKLTFPEGLRVEEIADIAASQLGFSSQEFLSLAKSQEGYLFPDTYYVSPDTSASSLLEKMVNNFHLKTSSENPSFNDLVLASLIERETRGQEEKPIVAGILKKRLAAGWPLELDATMQYIVGGAKEWWPHTTILDRQRPSPYNTYLNLGLPPGPICNPGLASISAAMNPVDSPYWFYLHDPTGAIRYAKTLTEHEANITKYLRSGSN